MAAFFFCDVPLSGGPDFDFVPVFFSPFSWRTRFFGGGFVLLRAAALVATPLAGFAICASFDAIFALGSLATFASVVAFSAPCFCSVDEFGSALRAFSTSSR